MKKCQITQLNWKASENWQTFNADEICILIKKIKEFYPKVLKKSTENQFLSQAEIDILGANINNTHNEYYAVDVAFHKYGLRYENNVEKISEKLIRSALLLYKFFNVKNGDIIFASPKILPKDIIPLQNRIAEIGELMTKLGFNFSFKLIANEDFKEEILMKIINKADKIADTSELFMRAFQLYNLCNKKNNCKNDINKILEELKF